MGCRFIINHWRFIDSTLMMNKNHQVTLPYHSIKWLALGCLLIMVFSFGNLKSGAINYSWQEIFHAICQSCQSHCAHIEKYRVIAINIIQVRLPMVLMGAMAGAGLALAGLMLQRITKNPLACPSLLGIEYGTAFSVILSYLFIPHISRTAIVGLATLGGLLTYVLMQIVINHTKASMIGITLIGVAFNTLYYSMIQAILLAFPYQAQAILYDLNGSLQSIHLSDIKLIAIPFTLLVGISFLLSNRLSLLDLDEEQAASLGVPIQYLRLILLALSILLTTLIVSFIGPLLFFGLIIPHLVKPFARPHESMLFCAIFGAAFLLIAEWFTHIISPLSPPPLGIIVLIMSAPILLVITRRYLGHAET